MLPYPVQKVVPITTAAIPSEETSRIKIIVEGDDIQNDSNFVPDNSFINSSLSQSTTFSRDFHDTGFNDIYKASSSFEIESIWGFQPKKSVNVEHDTDSVDLEAGGPTVIPETRGLPIDEAVDTTPLASEIFSVDPLPDGCILPMLGVSCDFLVLVRDLCVTMYGPTAVEKMTTRDVADRLFAAWRPPQSNRPSASPFPTSFLSHFQSQYSRVAHPGLGCCCSPLLVHEATVFVTHCWSYTFEALVDALQEFSRLRQASGEPRPFFWLDFFLTRDGEDLLPESMPSPSPSPSPSRPSPSRPSPSSSSSWSSPARPSPSPSPSILPAEEEEPRAQVSLRIRMGLLTLRRIGRVCVVLLPWSAPLTLRDGRCLLELLVACTRDGGDPDLLRPQCELLLQLSARRHLSYLHLCSENFQAAEAALDLTAVSASCQHMDGDSVTDRRSQAFIRDQMRSFRGGDGCAAVDALLSQRMAAWRSQAAISAARQRLRQCEQALADLRAGETAEAQEMRRPESASGPGSNPPAPAPTSNSSMGSCGRLTWFLEGLRCWLLCAPSSSSSSSSSSRRKDKDKQRELLLETGKVRSTLAALLHRSGHSAEAEQLYKQLLRDQLLMTDGQAAAPSSDGQQATEAGRPENHPLALSAAGNLAVLLRAQGRERWAEAESLYRRVLARKTQVLGASHPSTLVTTFNLAALLRDQDSRRAEAEQMLRLLLSQQRAVLGREHEHCMRTMESLTGLLLEDGAADDQVMSALALLQELLALRMDVLGQHHPVTLQTTELLAALYLKQAMPQFAADLYQEALSGREAVQGPAHSATWAARLRLAAVLKLLGSQGSHAHRERARTMFVALADYFPSQLGPSHPTSLAVKEALAELCMLTGQAAQAEKILRSMLLSPSPSSYPSSPSPYPSGSGSGWSTEFLLAECLMMLARYEEAELLHRRVLGNRRQRLGWSHVDCFRSMHALANALVSQRQWSEAKQLLQQALEGLDTLLGPQHPYCTNAAEVLWRLCRRSGDLQQAEVLLSRLSAAAAAAVSSSSSPASRGFYALREDDFSGSDQEIDDRDGDGDRGREGADADDDDDESGLREDSITMSLGRGRRGRGRGRRLEEQQPQSQEDEDDDDDDDDESEEEDEGGPDSDGDGDGDGDRRPAERRGRAAPATQTQTQTQTNGAAGQGGQSTYRTRTFTSYRR